MYEVGEQGTGDGLDCGVHRKETGLSLVGRTVWGGAAWASQMGQWHEQSRRWLWCGVCVHILQTVGSVWGISFVGTQRRCVSW